MYDELVKRLRCQLYGNCPACVNWYTEEVEPNLLESAITGIRKRDAYCTMPRATRRGRNEHGLFQLWMSVSRERNIKL